MYEDISQFAGTWGLVLLVVLFIAAVVYALWPGHKKKFERAKRIPLEENERKNKEEDRP